MAAHDQRVRHAAVRIDDAFEDDLALHAGAPGEFRVDGSRTARCIATQDRVFRVHVQPFGGGPPLQTTVVFTAPATTCTNLDTGNLVGTVDISPFVNQAIRIVFEWFIPESFTGPASSSWTMCSPTRRCPSS
jgi:hypothetical protein